MSGDYSDDDWEAVFDREEAHEAARKQDASSQNVSKNSKQIDVPAAKSEQVSKKSGVTIKTQTKTNLAYDTANDVELDDPVLERQRRERLIQKAEAQLFGDLLDGCEIEMPEDASGASPDEDYLGFNGSRKIAISSAPTLDSLTFKNMADCKKAVDVLAPKIEASTARSVAWLELLTGLLNHCAVKMEDKDLRTLVKKTNELIKDREASRRVQVQSKRKVNESVSSRITNYKDELDLFYGGDVGASQESDDEAEDDDDDGFM